MKKLSFLMVVLVMVMVLFTGCIFKKDGTDTVAKTISEVRNSIMSNKTTWTEFDAPDRLTATTGIVLYEYVENSDSTKNYVFISDENGNGLKLSYLHAREYNGLFNVGDKIAVSGVPYYKTWDDPSVGELRMDVSNYGTTTVTQTNAGLPTPKTVTSELSMNDFGNFIEFTGKYTSSDQYGNKTFTLANSDVIVVDSHSVMPALTAESTYTVKGAVGQSYGYRLFTADASWTTLVEAAPVQPPTPGDYTGIAKVKNDFLNGTTTFTDLEGVIYHINSGKPYIMDATTGIYINYSLSEGNYVIGDKIKVSGEIYQDTYNGNFRLTNITAHSLISHDNPVNPEVLNEDIWTKTEWTDSVTLGHNFVTAAGTLTNFGDGYAYEFAYDTPTGDATILAFSKTNIDAANGGEITTTKSATLTGYLEQYKHDWELKVRDSNDVSF